MPLPTHPDEGQHVLPHGAEAIRVLAIVQHERRRQAGGMQSCRDSRRGGGLVAGAGAWEAGKAAGTAGQGG